MKLYWAIAIGGDELFERVLLWIFVKENNWLIGNRGAGDVERVLLYFLRFAGEFKKRD